jgi:predicted TPR repeat methyltransferase
VTAVRLERDYFEDLYAADSDPWRFATSTYEQEKYARTVASLEGRRYARGLEVGCSIGVLTERLAEVCDALVGVDVSARAVATARERLAGVDGVTVECRSLPEETPDGPFDLIVCSEVLYYFDAELLSTVLDGLLARLEPGGSLLAVHWRPATQTYPLQGGEVHELLRDRPGLEVGRSEKTRQYLLDRLELTA